MRKGWGGHLFWLIVAVIFVILDAGGMSADTGFVLVLDWFVFFVWGYITYRELTWFFGKPVTGRKP